MSEKKALSCRLGRHDWEHEYNDEGQGYYLCSRCGTTKDEFHLGDQQAR